MRPRQPPEAARVVIVGGGGFGREVLDVVEDVTAAGSAELQVVGVVDAGLSETNIDRWRQREVPYLGDDAQWLAAPNATHFVAAVGAPAVRRRIVQKYVSAGLLPLTLIHPTAIIGRRSTVGVGAVICAGVVASSNVHVGDYVHINPNATVGHDAILSPYCSVNPGAIISGEVRIGDEALIGAGAVVLENLHVGRGGIVGAAACVTRSVADETTVAGVPARAFPAS